MKDYIVKLMNKDEVYITEKEFNSLKGKEGAIYVPSINEIINLNRVERIYKAEDVNRANLFLPKQKGAQSFDRIGAAKSIEGLFMGLKANGLFQNYVDYAAWEGRDKKASKF